jgi:hypothetical protein
LKAIKSMGLDEAQLQKLFGRSEGLVAYRNILTNEADFTASVGRQTKAQESNLFDQVLSLPAQDPILRAAKLERIGESEKLASDRPLSEIPMIHEAIESKEYAKGGLLWKGTQWMRDMRHKFYPGSSARGIREALTSGELDDNPELLRASVEALGGPEKAFGEKREDVSKFFPKREKSWKIYDESTKSMEPVVKAISDGNDKVVKAMEDNTKAIQDNTADRSRNKSPALGTRDPGDK